MLVGQQQRLQDDIREIVAQLGRDRSALIPVLQELQKRHATVSDFAMQVVADELGLHPAEVYGVTSFYAFLRQPAQGRFVFRLCRTLSCEFEGKSRVARQLENDLGIGFGQATPDGRFGLEWASCLGLCDQGPALLVNERVYTRVTPERVHEIIDECRRTFGAHARQAGHSQVEGGLS